MGPETMIKRRVPRALPPEKNIKQNPLNKCKRNGKRYENNIRKCEKNGKPVFTPYIESKDAPGA